MENKEEYHDPDYPEAAVTVKEEAPSPVSEDHKVQKIREIVHREFRNELNVRENEVTLIDQRMTTARRLLHQLRYTLVNNYYKDQKLQLTNSQIEDDVAAQTEPRARAEASSILRDSQRRLHPSVRKLLGKKSVDIEEIFKSREPRNKARKDYSAMLQSKNYTISADATTSLRPIEEKVKEEIEEPSSSKVKKIPRQIDPKVNNVVTLDEVTRNKKKHRFRFIIGNTSKYAPPASRQDRSTHKWLLYVRAPPPRDAARALSAVHVALHRSYAPHHRVCVDKPPFVISRRGWGEFPARVTLHFHRADLNRPATLTHTIKLDRHYTGLQTLGAETIADVWLYSTPEMLECEFKPEEETYLEKPIEQPKPEIEPPTTKVEAKDEDNKLNKVKQENDSWLEFFAKDTSEVNVEEMLVKNVKSEPVTQVVENEAETESEAEREVARNHIANGDINEVPKKRIMKYMEPATRKIYYLEIDKTLDISKVREIVINSQATSPNKNGVKHRKVSLLKPEVKQQLRAERSEFSHIENDHCYLKSSVAWFNPVQVRECYVDTLKSVVTRFTSVRMIVNYLLRKLPLISDSVGVSDKSLPFVVESEDRYWKLDFAKRRNMEWSRAKLINKILNEQFKMEPNKIWRTKQILVFSRLHGYYPVRMETVRKQDEDSEWSSWNDLENSRKTENYIRKMYPNPKDINSLTVFRSDSFGPSVETASVSDDEDLDVVGEGKVEVKSEVCTNNLDLEVLPVDKEDKLRFFFVETKCSDIGIELRNEDVGGGYCYSAVHAVLTSAMKNFAEDLLRSSLADQLAASQDPQLPTIWIGGARARLRPEHVWRAARRVASLSRAGLASTSADPHPV